MLGVGAGGRYGALVGDAVSACGALDASFSEELLQCLGDGCRPGCGAFADLALREGRVRVGEHLEDSPLRCFRSRRGIGGLDLAQPQGQPLAVVVELDLDVIEAGGGTMLDGHEDLAVAALEAKIAVSPGVQFTAPAQGLPGPGGAALSGVMDEQDGGLEAALDVAQEAEDAVVANRRANAFVS